MDGDTRLDDISEENVRLRTHLEAVTEIGIALSAERDLTSLLRAILTSARELTRADAGSLYLVEGENREALRFVLAQNDSIEVPFVEMVLGVDSPTIAGYVVRERQVVEVADLYSLPEDSPFDFSTEFDTSVGYRSKSMLCVPLIDHRDRVLGCLQLINRKPSRELVLTDGAHAEEVVEPFTGECVTLLQSLASQSAVAIDKARLIESLERTFEGLVYASVIAIESRDPTTSGHSERVAQLSVALAKAVSDTGDGKFAGVEFDSRQLKELRYASLLHDFGKVGVRERVLVKAKKLYPWDMDSVRLRFLCAIRERETQVLRELLRAFAANELPGDPQALLTEAEARIEAETGRLKTYLEAVLEANEPKVLADGTIAELSDLAGQVYLDLSGHAHPLLTDEEMEDLKIPRGSLNPEQRQEIESHVTHTYRFLRRIPWTEDLRDLPLIAGTHHEKLDGTGYPKGLTDLDIPPRAKIMSVADIFDALTAWDRPYKKALPLDKALWILEAEAKGGKIEPQLVDIFRERKLFELVRRPGS
jgi:HD-GYP domain-containing protein (c-di-GMP phosphodiesterase class II)